MRQSTPELAGVFISLQNLLKVLDEDLREGRLDKAFLTAHTMEDRLDQIKRRLNEIKYERKDQ